MRKQRTETRKQRDPEAFGAFMPDGAYFADARLGQRGPTDRFVRSMVKSRGAYGFDPKTAAEAIVLTKQEQAFPNHRQWAGQSPAHLGELPPPAWPAVWTSTSAEEAVKRCGLGIADPRDGTPRHWCGDLWVAGDEKHCANTKHRERASNDFVRVLLDRVLASLPKGLAS